ncbi:allatostatins-like protein [Dinothrombium tinctorium]|uniref:Allatostatins-like protein n=2 Tax=Dinothrombium tinctorium TaxID=1965070 RepID=A0A3S3S934_9ACAR|nr:allatostatins-like protein [Dinothrombium tinctorium]
MEKAISGSDVSKSGIGSGSDAWLNEMEKKAGSRSYNFGLGKRDRELFDDNREDYLNEVDANSYEKRADPQRFSFGLGKRPAAGANRFAFGLGKRNNDGFDASGGVEYLLEKKAPSPRYQFGLGKKAASRYAFGLGKRELAQKQFEDLFKRRYSFGLGKR